jgi:hypothetical protein
MARNFNGTDQRITGSLTLALGATNGFTLAGWARWTAFSTTRHAASLHTDTGNHYALLYRASTNRLAANLLTGTNTLLEWSSAPSLHTWYHMALVVASPTERRFFVNGIERAGGAGLAAIDPGLRQNLMLGDNAAAPAAYNVMNGDLAAWAVWQKPLAASEVAAIARGVSPLQVGAAQLVAYLPLSGNASPETDWKGGGAFTLINAPGVAAHPRVRAPGRPLLPRRSGMAVTVAVPSASIALNSFVSTPRLATAERITPAAASLLILSAAAGIRLMRATEGSAVPAPWQSETSAEAGAWQTVRHTDAAWQPAEDPPSAWSAAP